MWPQWTTFVPHVLVSTWTWPLKLLSSSFDWPNLNSPNISFRRNCSLQQQWPTKGELHKNSQNANITTNSERDRQSTRVSSYVEFNYRTDYTVLKILEIYDCVTRNTSLISSKMATIFLILILIFLTHISDKEEHSLWIKFSLLISLWKQIHNFNYVCVCVFVWSNIQEDGIAQQKLCNQWLLLDGFGCSWTNY